MKIPKIQFSKFFILFLISINCISAQQIAFPSASGAAANLVTGGSGGQVIHVTNLNDSGAGSFREALQTSGSRIIVFDVSGVINLTSDLVTTYGDFTVAGQTAPEGGITIIGTTSIRVQADNHIWRYIRFRCGYDNSNVDGGWANITSGVATRNYSNFIFDHCSSALAKETAGMGGGMDDDGGQNPNLTSQNNLIVESARGTLVGDSNDADSSTVTVYRNGYINVGWRFPKAGGTISLDVINTYVYNWQNRTIRMDGYNYKLNVIGNYYQAGNLTRLSDNPEIMYTTFTNQTMNPLIWDEDNKWEPYVYNSGSSTYDPKSGRNYPADKSTAWDPFYSSTEPIDSNWFVSSRLPLEGVAPPILPSNQVKDSVLDGSGANKYIDDNGNVQTYRDKIDSGAINIAKGLSTSYTINGTVYDLSDGTKLNQSDYETIALDLVNDTPSFTRPGNFYQSNAHIPEAYLVSRGITGSATIHNQVQPSGYTLLEEYINQVDSVEAIGLDGVTVSPESTTIEIGASEQLNVSFNPVNATNQTGTWTSSDTSIATVDSNGLVTGVAASDTPVVITFTSNDGPHTDTSQITVFDEALQASAGDDQSICEGESTTLTATGGTDYLWNTGDTTASIDVSPSTTTTYTVTVSNGEGESDSDDVMVTVNTIPVANAGADQTICEGETVTLTASGGTSYLWNTGETTSNIEVSPASNTVYSVEVFQNNCSSSDDVTVNVNPAPIVTVSQDITINEGESTILTAEGASSYLWSTGQTSESITVSPTQTTTYTVTGTSNTCSAQAQVTVSVGNFEANAGEDQRVCENDDYSVTLSAGQGDSFLWSTGETTQSITVSPLSTTEYSVTVTSGNVSDDDSVTVFVDPNPNVTIVNGNNVDILTGDFITLTATGANTYEWNNGATQPNIAVSPSQTTTYEVRGYINDCYDEKQVTVNVYQEVQASAGEDVTICLDDSVILSANGGDEYLWSTGETTQSIEVSPEITTDYFVTVFNPMDFDEAAVRVEVDTECDLQPTEPQDETLGFGMDFYPNPADRYVDIDVYGTFETSEIEVYDITGKLVIKRKIQNDNTYSTVSKRINISRLQEGIYVLRLIDENRNISKKLIVN